VSEWDETPTTSMKFSWIEIDRFHSLVLTLLNHFVDISLTSFNKYVAIASRTLRQALKEEKRVAVDAAAPLETRAARWSEGKRK
jgi:Mitochondrial ATP synthase epsilon chain